MNTIRQPDFANISILSGIFLVSLLWFWILMVPTSSPYLEGNESAHVKTLVAIVVKGQFEINPFKSDAACVYRQCYSNKPPGYAVAMAPFFYIKQALFIDDQAYPFQSAYDFARLFNILCSALTTLVVFLMLRRLTENRRTALFGVLAAMLGTVYPAYAALATSHPLSILLIVSALYLWISKEEARSTAIRLSLITMICCYSIAVDYSNFFYVIPFIFVVANQAVRNPLLLLVCILSCWPIYALVLFHSIHFGGPFTPSYKFYIPPRYVPWDGIEGSLSPARVPSGLWNYFLSPSRGMLVLSPVILLAFFAFFDKTLWRRLAFPLLVVSSGTLILSGYIFWHGGHSVGYRHVFPSAIILASLSCMFLIDANSLKRVFAVSLLIISCTSGVLSSFIQTNRYLLSQTWKEEPYDVHANYYMELVLPLVAHRLNSLISETEQDR